jgi:hypothetical protein
MYISNSRFHFPKQGGHIAPQLVVARFVLKGHGLSDSWQENDFAAIHFLSFLIESESPIQAGPAH